MSEQGYGMRVERDIYVTMRDGTRIALKVYRPDAPGHFPALFAASPYQYDTDDLPSLPLFLWRETGPVEWWVSQGYALVRMDVRGSGRSEGTYGYLDAVEQADCAEVIAWVARQPWCNGRVGGYGQSYYAMSQWLYAALRPEGLACIAPYDGLIDPYRDQTYHGGVYCPFPANWYAGVRANNLLRPANAPGGKDMGIDLAAEILRHATYDDWWRERTADERLERIEVPVLSIGHWGKMGLHLRGNILGYERVRSAKWLMVTGARNAIEAHHLFDEIDFHREYLKPFYDAYLRDDPTTLEGTPRVRLWVRGAEHYQDFSAWPIPGTQEVDFHLRQGPSGSVTSLNDGGLSIEPPVDGEGSSTYSYPDHQWVNGVVARTKEGPDPVRRILTFTSAPLERDILVAGPIVLDLWASSDQPDTDFIVKVSDVLPREPGAGEAGTQPAYTVITKGWLRASHRQEDMERTTAERPFYTHADPQPLTAGEACLFRIEVQPVAALLRAGHRLRVELANGDSSLTDGSFAHQYLWFKQGVDSIWHEPEHPSLLRLPVLPG